MKSQILYTIILLLVGVAPARGADLASLPPDCELQSGNASAVNCFDFDWSNRCVQQALAPQTSTDARAEDMIEKEAEAFTTGQFKILNLANGTIEDANFYSEEIAQVGPNEAPEPVTAILDVFANMATLGGINIVVVKALEPKLAADLKATAEPYYKNLMNEHACSGTTLK